jgi:FMN phosphatase YigB (HAD superfamily)
MAVGPQPLAGGVSTGGQIDAVLFDIGGVILQMGDIATLGPFNGVHDTSAIQRIWLDSPIVDAHERGQIGADEFAARMIETYAIGCSPSAFLDRCIAWHGDVFDGVEETIAAIDPGVRVGCLSNTCDYHWRNHARSADVERLFSLQFLSFRMGVMKPEPEIYRMAAEQLGCAPDRILFFDDTERHVVGARQFGFDAHRVQGMAEARRILDERGLLGAT